MTKSRLILALLILLGMTWRIPMLANLAYTQVAPNSISIPNSKAELLALPALGQRVVASRNSETLVWENASSRGAAIFSMTGDIPRLIEEIDWPNQVKLFDISDDGEEISVVTNDGKFWDYDFSKKLWENKRSSDLRAFDQRERWSVSSLSKWKEDDGLLIGADVEKRLNYELFYFGGAGQAGPKALVSSVLWHWADSRAGRLYAVTEGRLIAYQYENHAFRQIWETPLIFDSDADFGVVGWGAGNISNEYYTGAIFANGKYLFVCPKAVIGSEVGWMVFDTMNGRLVQHERFTETDGDRFFGCIYNGYEADSFLLDLTKITLEETLFETDAANEIYRVLLDRSGTVSVVRSQSSLPFLDRFENKTFVDNGTVFYADNVCVFGGVSGDCIPQNLRSMEPFDLALSEDRDRLGVSIRTSRFRTYSGLASNIAAVINLDEGAIERFVQYPAENSRSIEYHEDVGASTRPRERPGADHSIAFGRSNREVLLASESALIIDAPSETPILRFLRQQMAPRSVGDSTIGPIGIHAAHLKFSSSHQRGTYFWCDHEKALMMENNISDGSKITIRDIRQSNTADEYHGHPYHFYNCLFSAVAGRSSSSVITHMDERAATLKITLGDKQRVIELDGQTGSIRISPDGRLVTRVVLPESEWVQNSELGSGERVWKPARVQIFDSATAKLIWEQPVQGRIRHIEFSASGSNLAFIYETSYESEYLRSDRSSVRLAIVDIRTGYVTSSSEIPRSNYRDLIFDASKELIILSDTSGEITFWNQKTLSKIAGLRMFRDASWVVIAPSGRYDASSPGDANQLSWIVQDDLSGPLPLETFFREYYTPGLLGKLLRREELPELASITDIDRTLPEMEITSIKPDGKDAVRVTVAASSIASTFTEGTFTGIEGLRLSRDGQMVGEALVGGAAIKSDAGGVHEIVFDNIQLPNSKEAGSVEFSAYAFSQAGIKSLTARNTYEVPANSAPTRRAYVLTMGVDAYDDPAWTLKYAAADARAYADRFSAGLEVDGAPITDISVVRLVSDEMAEEGEAAATSANLEAALRVLAGGPATQEELERIPGLSDLSRVKPDDVVILAFSGHGFAAEDGQFYFFGADIPSDNGREITPELLDAAISSTELRAWVSAIDAGQFVMIIDACNSGASVAGLGGFRPGPLGSRDFGQLAYDKQMTVLAASSAESVALESEQIGHGLLTYALLLEGADDGLADAGAKDGEISLQEMLEYGRARVPELYEEISTGAYVPGTRAAAPIYVDQGADGQANGTFLPVMFDFSERELERVRLGQRPK